MGRKRGSSPKAKKIKLSDEAKSLIRGLIVANGKKRLSIHKIKKHEFFGSINWTDIEKLKIRMPHVRQREPNGGNFEEVEPDSCDEDFEHEYEELIGRDSNSGSSNQFAHLP